MPSASMRAITQAGGLELLVERATGERRRASLLFIHGINVGAWVWQEHFLPYFAGVGFDCYALSLRGHGESDGRERIRDWSLADYVADVTAAVRQIEGPLILIGHSMGGAVVQRYIREGGRADGMALLTSVPPWGMAPSAIAVAMTRPNLFLKLSSMLSGTIPQLDRSTLHEVLFSPDAPTALLDAFADRAGPESPKVAAGIQGLPPIAPWPWQSLPTFVLGAANDRLIPTGEISRTALYYGCRAEIVPELAHAVMVEPRWAEAARCLHAWLGKTAS
jgi:pimeloyl-ACP methyl ester carboxylesterase